MGGLDLVRSITGQSPLLRARVGWTEILLLFISRFLGYSLSKGMATSC